MSPPRPDKGPAMRDQPDIARWMLLAVAAEALAAAIMLAAFGTGERGTVGALELTGRISFVLFWPAYAGGALAALFGPAFLWLKRRGRAFGLACAAGHSVHAALIGWLCWIGAAPALPIFVFFGGALICLYLLAAGSIARVRRAIGPVGWRILQVVGMNYIAYAFAKDFMKFHDGAGARFLLAYAPFIVLSVAGPALVFAAFVRRMLGAAPAVSALAPRAASALLSRREG